MGEVVFPCDFQPLSKYEWHMPLDIGRHVHDINSEAMPVSMPQMMNTDILIQSTLIPESRATCSLLPAAAYTFCHTWYADVVLGYGNPAGSLSHTDRVRVGKGAFNNA